jgi:hypothetical protein
MKYATSGTDVNGRRPRRRPGFANYRLTQRKRRVAMKLPPCCRPVTRGPRSGRRLADDSVGPSQDEIIDEEDLMEDLTPEGLPENINPSGEGLAGYE